MRTAVIIGIAVCCCLAIMAVVLGVYFGNVACPDFGSTCPPGTPSPLPAPVRTPGPAPAPVRTPGPTTLGPSPRVSLTPVTPTSLNSLPTTPDAPPPVEPEAAPPPPPSSTPPPPGVPFTCPTVSCQSNQYMIGTCDTTKKTDTRQCLNCPANSSPNNDKTACLCNSGYMKAYNMSTNDRDGLKCNALPAGTTLDSYGRVTCISPYVMSSTGCTIPPQTCPVGYELRDNYPVCQMCELGKYKNDTGTQCHDCPDGTTNGYRGSTNCPINTGPPAPPPNPFVSSGQWGGSYTITGQMVDSDGMMVSPPPPEPEYVREHGD